MHKTRRSRHKRMLTERRRRLHGWSSRPGSCDLSGSRSQWTFEVSSSTTTTIFLVWLNAVIEWMQSGTREVRACRLQPRHQSPGGCCRSLMTRWFQAPWLERSRSSRQHWARRQCHRCHRCLRSRSHNHSRNHNHCPCPCHPARSFDKGDLGSFIENWKQKKKVRSKNKQQTLKKKIKKGLRKRPQS